LLQSRVGNKIEAMAAPLAQAHVHNKHASGTDAGF